MVKSEIGVNAGIIWQYLDSKGECSTDALKEQLEMNDAEFYMAIGWLSRENKIYFFHSEKELYVCITE